MAAAHEDKLSMQYAALLNPENKEAVLAKYDQYSEAGKAFINAHHFFNVREKDSKQDSFNASN